jgi:hypothetical protein
MAEAAPGTAADAKAKGGKWWHLLLWGAAMLGFAVWMYYDLTSFETVGGTKRMNSILALLYNILGKWGVVGFFGIIGVGMAAVGVKQKLSDAAK